MAGGGQGGDHPWREYLAEATAGGPRGFAGEEGAQEVDFMSPPPMAPRCCLSTRSTCWTSRASPSSTGPWRVTWHLSSSWPPTAASPGENGRAGWQEGHRVVYPVARAAEHLVGELRCCSGLPSGAGARAAGVLSLKQKQASARGWWVPSCTGRSGTQHALSFLVPRGLKVTDSKLCAQAGTRGAAENTGVLWVFSNV